MSAATLPPAPSTNTKPSLRRALIYYVAFVTLGLTIASTGPTLNGLADQTGSDLGQISAVFTASSLGFTLGSLLGGRLYDRFPGHPLLTITLLVTAGLLFAIPLMPGLWLLLTCFLLLGGATAMLDLGANALIIWLFRREVGPYMNALHFSFGVGALLSPLMVDRVFVLTGGIRWAYWLLAILFLPVAIWMAFVPSPHNQDRQESGGEGPRMRYGWLIFLTAGMMALHVGAESSFGGWIFSYAVAREIGTETTARLLNSFFWGAFTLGRLAAIPLSRRLLPRVMLLLAVIGALCSFGLIILLPGWLPVIWIGAAGVGLSIAPMYATVMNFAERRMPITGRATSLIIIGGSSGSMVLPWIIGQLFVSAGPQSMMITLGIDILLLAALFAVTLAYTRRLPAQRATSPVEV